MKASPVSRIAGTVRQPHDKPAGRAERASIVAPARRSKAARRKAAAKRTDDGLPVLSFRSLIDELAILTRNTMAMADSTNASFILYPEPTAIQARAFQLLGVATKM